MREAGRETGRAHRCCQRGYRGNRTQSGGQGWGVCVCACQGTPWVKDMGEERYREMEESSGAVEGC